MSSGRIAGADTACWTPLYNTNNISITSISPNTKHGKKQKQEEKRNKNKTKEEGTRKKETEKRNTHSYRFGIVSAE
jgi:hypothetical protein